MNLISATEHLVTSMSHEAWEESSSLTGYSKNAIPLDIIGFKWLAKTVDNIIITTDLLAIEEQEPKLAAIQLKRKFF